MKIPAQFMHVGFFDLLCDALMQHNQSQQNENNNYRCNRFARSSICASVLSIESCANALLQQIDIAPQTLNDLDRMPALSKIDMYLRVEHQLSGLDYGNNIVQKVKELLQIRNQFVHQKGTKIKTGIGKPEDGNENWILPMDLEGKLHKQIKIPKCSMFWSNYNAYEVLKAVFDFYNYLFHELVPLNEEELIPILMNRIQFNNYVMPNLFDEMYTELQEAESIKLKLKFFDMSPLKRT
ncbi:hypothetical protein P3656_19935 [Vibrio parahaemolyticus]|uniref:hypothetical protein n=1 Tax=Vibrio parahaemolyticus TaxID=670 RepID=UPI00146A884F|nr:hypothetical protein [Vibrio parahaemolyticus]EJE8521962.1 hypothetical protein [Vibrio parahaemolyticus]EJG1645977.1 hypothetical protein [Vibrio parahaemolyticus]ELA9390984.1 hypothetical protein [Vibrio parahaemolyticus]MDF5023914.1 hypothetical protein [Vibrio parahaemolyticus]MDF5043250.1 hypothetical protein [Vibrio parahaemolyticus]